MAPPTKTTTKVSSGLTGSPLMMGSINRSCTAPVTNAIMMVPHCVRRSKEDLPLPSVPRPLPARSGQDREVQPRQGEGPACQWEMDLPVPPSSTLMEYDHLTELRAFVREELEQMTTKVGEMRAQLFDDVAEIRHRIEALEFKSYTSMEEARLNVEDISGNLGSLLHRVDVVETMGESNRDAGLDLEGRCQTTVDKMLELEAQVSSMTQEHGKRLLNAEETSELFDSRLVAVQEQHMAEMSLVAKDIFQIAKHETLGGVPTEHLKTFHLLAGRVDHNLSAPNYSESPASSRGRAIKKTIQKSQLRRHLTFSGVKSEVRTCSFTEDVFCSVVFLCYPQLEFFENLSLLVSLLLNTVFRIVFCLMLRNIVANGAQEYDAAVSQGLSSWRESTDVGVVERACLGDDTLGDQYKVRDLNSKLSFYFAPVHDIPFMMWGPGLLCLILSTWALTVVCSLREKFDLLTAVLGKYQSGESDSTRIVENKQSYIIEFVPFRRVVWTGLLLLLEAVITLFLFISACQWLISLTSLSAILSSAVVLTYILDERVVYSVFVPTPIKSLISALDPLPLKEHFTRFRPFLTFLVAFVLLIAVCFLELSPRMDRMEEVRDSMCAGERLL